MTADKCPPECQVELIHINKELSGHGKTLYGEDGSTGLVSHVKSKVSKKALIGWIGSITGVLAIYVLSGMTAWGTAKDERKENKQNIAVIQKDVQNKFDALEKSMDEIKHKLIDPDNLLREIRKIVNTE